MRQGWAVYKLRRGVGDTWFYSADGRAVVPDGRAAARRLARRRSAPDLRNAIIAVEDHRFYRHVGIDPIGARPRGLARRARPDSSKGAAR